MASSVILYLICIEKYSEEFTGFTSLSKRSRTQKKAVNGGLSLRGLKKGKEYCDNPKDGRRKVWLEALRITWKLRTSQN